MKIDIALSLDREHRTVFPLQVKSGSSKADSSILLSNEDLRALNRAYKSLAGSCKPMSTSVSQAALLVRSNIPLINHQKGGKSKTAIKAELLAAMRARTLKLAKPIDELSQVEILTSLFKQGFLAERYHRR